jgi:parallel beta-helix repeat protein
VSFVPAPSDRCSQSSVLWSKSSRSFSWIPTIAWMGLTAVVPLVLHSQAIAQTVPFTVSQSVPSSVNATVLRVNPVAGNDATADGSDRSPFKTITQALQVAQPNTTIQLTPGTYSEATGEKFPLALKPGITIQGNAQNRGSDTVIQGGGFLLSPAFARQNVTIVGASKATLTGVTVTNSHPQGYGLWIESVNLNVTDSTFSASGRDGISVLGNSASLIRNNYFYQNGANGITVYGTSRPEIRENIFEQTGFAINLNQNSAPLIIGNRITQNKEGIVTQANSQPILRNNSIENNEQDGVVAIAQSRPDLGTANEPGGNFIRNNGHYDVNVQSSNQSISAFGNELDQTLGQLNLGGTATEAASVATSTPEATGPLPTVTVAASLPPKRSSQTTSAALKDAHPGEKPTIALPKPTVAPTSKPTPSTIPFGARLSVAKPPVAAIESPFPIPTALSGKTETPQPHRPIQLVQLSGSEATPAPSPEAKGTQERGTARTVPNVFASPRPRIPASQSSQEKPSTSAPAFPTPTLLTTTDASRVALVPNSPPVSLALPVSESSQNLPLNPEKNQAAALGKNPVQVQLPNFIRKAVPVAPVVANKSPLPDAAAKAPQRNENVPPVSAGNDAKPSSASRQIDIPVPAPEVRSNPVVSLASRPVEIPVPTPEVRSSPVVSLASRPVEIPVPVPEVRSNPVLSPVVTRPSTPPTPTPVLISAAQKDSLGLLPVPDANVPIGNAGGRLKAIAMGNGGQGDASGPPAPPDRGDLVGVRYRVLVEAENDSQQAQIRTLVPNAFPTSSQGRSVMQVGAFGDRLKADQFMQSLVSQGLKAMIEPME